MDLAKIIQKIYINILILLLTTISFVACANETIKEQIIISGTKPNMRYINNGRVKMGVDLNLGGAITYLSDQENGGENMVNSYDWGRQIQQSYYSGPWPYIGPKGEKPTEEWASLGWNPIQSGDAGNNRSKVIEFKQISDTSFFIQSIPMQWPHKTGVKGECIFESYYILEDNVVSLKATIINHRLDKTQYSACAQEMPAVYTNGSWYKVVTYLGDQPFLNQPTTDIVKRDDNKGWPWVHFYTPERWVALLDDKNKGIGVYQPEVLIFNAGFHPNDHYKGFGDDKDVQTGHIAPIAKQILDHNISWTYETKFVLGTLDDIRKKVYDFESKTSRSLDWIFKDERHYWYFEGAMRDKGFPINGALDITYENLSSLVSPITFWNALDRNKIIIEGIFSTDSKDLNMTLSIQPVSKSDFTDWLNWSEGTADVNFERRMKAESFSQKPEIILNFKILADGKKNRHEIDLSNLKEYFGALKNLKFTMHNKGSAKIQRISVQ